MLVETAPGSNGERILRRSLPFAVAGLVSVALITGYSVAFAQDITSDTDKLDQSANIIWMLGAFLVFSCRRDSPSWAQDSSEPRTPPTT